MQLLQFCCRSVFATCARYKLKDSPLVDGVKFYGEQTDDTSRTFQELKRTISTPITGLGMINDVSKRVIPRAICNERGSILEMK